MDTLFNYFCFIKIFTTYKSYISYLFMALSKLDFNYVQEKKESDIEYFRVYRR